jgi:ribosomal protein S7
MKNNLLANHLKKNKYYNKINFLFKQNFTGKLIKKGKKLYAIKYFNKVKYFIKKKFKKDFNVLLFLIVFYSTIKFHFIKKRFGGAKKEIPLYLNKDRQIKFIIKKIFNYSKSSEKRKSLDINKLIYLFFLTMKKKGVLVSDKYKSFIKAKENRILVKSLKK